ncbi:hypothetical protein [Enterobacter kobei]|uniref:hypothetical protein n=1 Tax=Enterobacter kobei TaxID=208224 RepID=UPI002FD66DEC
MTTIANIENDVSGEALQLLKDNLTNWRDGPSPVWRSTWPVFERFIGRHNEMQHVYRELGVTGVTGLKLWNLLEQFIFSGTFCTEENHTELRADYHELTVLNDAISDASTRLAGMLERRAKILNESGHFRCERMVGLPDLIDEAGRGNGHYQLHLRRELALLSRYDLKYWPGIADILHVMGLELVDIAFTDECTEAIVNARRPSLTDYFRVLFDHISALKTGDWYDLPKNFRMSDNALATVCNVALNLPSEDVTDAAYVKRTHHRLKEQGFTAGW